MMDSANSIISPIVGIESLFYEQEINTQVNRIPIYSTMISDYVVNNSYILDGGEPELTKVSVENIEFSNGAKRLVISVSPLSTIFKESRVYQELVTSIQLASNHSTLEIEFEGDISSEDSYMDGNILVVQGSKVDKVSTSVYDTSLFDVSIESPASDASYPYSVHGAFAFLHRDAYIPLNSQESPTRRNLFASINPISLGLQESSTSLLDTYDEDWGIRFIKSFQNSQGIDRIALKKPFYVPTYYGNNIVLAESITFSQNAYRDYPNRDMYEAEELLTRSSNISDGLTINYNRISNVIGISANSSLSPYMYFSTDGRINDIRNMVSELTPSIISATVSEIVPSMIDQRLEVAIEELQSVDILTIPKIIFLVRLAKPAEGLPYIKPSVVKVLTNDSLLRYTTSMLDSSYTANAGEYEIRIGSYTNNSLYYVLDPYSVEMSETYIGATGTDAMEDYERFKSLGSTMIQLVNIPDFDEDKTVTGPGSIVFTYDFNEYVRSFDEVPILYTIKVYGKILRSV